MKNLFLLFSLCPVFLWGQVKINFEKGLPEDHFQYPVNRWGVSSEKPLEGLYSLHHEFDNDKSATDIVSFKIPEPDPDSVISCGFKIHYEYNPSGSNNWCFYFLSEGNAEVMEQNFALSLGVNQTRTNDSLYVYLSIGEYFNELLNCGLNCETDMDQDPWEFLIKFQKDSFILVMGGLIDTSMDTLIKSNILEIPEFYPNHLGVRYSYTSSKDRLLKVDDIHFKAHIHSDSIPPQLTEIRVFDPKSLHFIFDENIFMNEGIFEFNSSIHADSFVIESNAVFVFFSGNISNNSLIEYKISGVTDRKGNSKTYQGEFEFYYPEYHDLIFSEIMSDPSPTVYLPESEYLEIYNRSNRLINLRDWQIFTGSRKWILPEVLIEPHNYNVFTGIDIHGSEFKVIEFTPLFSSGSAIANQGQDLLIYTRHGILIDAIRFENSWHEDLKSEGGWSLERIDLDNLCGKSENWSSSISWQGGTPGSQNSVSSIVNDYAEPFIRQIIYDNDSTFRIQFSEQLDRYIFEIAAQQMILKNPDILSMNLVNPFYDECTFTIVNQGLFLFEQAWTDCSGNISKGRDSILFRKPSSIHPGSVIITEVLFSPWPGCPEFIEIYNNSDSLLNLLDLKLCTNAERTEGEFLSDENVLFYPGTFLILSKDPETLSQYYDVPFNMRYLKVPGMRSLPDAAGRISLYDRAHRLIDEMHYSSANHFPLLEDMHGVSLERIVLDLNPGIFSKWHSASSMCGYATPGFQNSQNVFADDTKADFFSEEDVFTPNNDGDKDLAIIHAFMEKEGYVAMIRVFDSSGRLRRVIGNNVLLGTENIISWDGRDDNNRICQTGIYLVHLEAYHLSGDKKERKETIVLGRK